MARNIHQADLEALIAALQDQVAQKDAAIADLTAKAKASKPKWTEKDVAIKWNEAGTVGLQNLRGPASKGLAFYKQSVRKFLTPQFQALCQALIEDDRFPENADQARQMGFKVTEWKVRP